MFGGGDGAETRRSIEAEGGEGIESGHGEKSLWRGEEEQRARIHGGEEEEEEEKRRRNGRSRYLRIVLFAATIPLCVPSTLL